MPDSPPHGAIRRTRSIGCAPLLGVPVALKDLVSLAGGQCTAGSRILAGYRAPYDAHIVERLHDVGAVILGKTNMDEFAMGSSTEHSAYGPTANPWALDRVPGGSSGGSAAAVAAFHAPLAIGTDTGGSIRQPAALCGDRRDEADLWPGQPLRDRGVREFARPDRTVRAGRPRCGGPAARRGRSRRPRLHLVAGAGAGDPDRAADRRRRSGGRAPRQAVRPAARVLRGRHGAGRRGARPRGRRRARGGRRDRRGGQPPAHRLWPCDLLHRGARPRRRPTSRATTGSASVRGWATVRTCWPATWPPAARGSGPRSSAGSCSGRTRCRPATTTRTT